MDKEGAILMQRYELGRMLGQGAFAKVYYARNIMTGKSVAIKIIDKVKIMKVGLIDQIKREISVMRLVRHSNVVKLYEVMASKRRIYFAMEYVKGGELFNKVVRGRLPEDDARKYFQQLIAAVDFCHSRGVYHRDLKPENLLLDENGNLKVSDFGLSALIESRRQDGLLHTTCGTPAYVSPEVIHKKGYDGAKADIWSCGVILFVLLAGYLPFQHSNLMEMYRKIRKADFKCPQWFPPEVRKLLARILDPNPNTRITLDKIMENSWFQKGFNKIEVQYCPQEKRSLLLSEVQAAFSADSRCSSFDSLCSEGNSEKKEDVTSRMALKPTSFNAFDIISLSEGFNLSSLFENDENQKKESRFTTTKPAAEIVSKFEQIAYTESFKCMRRDGTLHLQGTKQGRKGQLGIDAEICEVTPSFYVVQLKKASGDTFEYKQFCNQGLKPSLKDIVWTWQGCEQQQALPS